VSDPLDPQFLSPLAAGPAAAPPFPISPRAEAPPPAGADGELVRTPDDVAVILRLHQLGWGTKRIAREVGCARNTVKRYLAQGTWAPVATRERPKTLDALADWVAERFRQHHGNADVVRQDLLREHGLAVSLRTVERAVAPLRQALRAEARATVRFETAPGEQLQVDFGVRRVVIAGVPEKLCFFVATLGYSRRCHVRVFRHERQAAWLDGLESAFHTFGGVTETVLLDNARALVLEARRKDAPATFHPRLLAFAAHWHFRPVACAPYRARTKGKDERGVGYVKANALAGHTCASFAALEAHLVAWTREVADVRIHGTTGEAPLERFLRDEAHRLRPLADRPSFQPTREWTRRVQSDCTIELHRNWYSVPWRLLGETVRVVQHGERLTIHHGATVVAEHAVAAGTRVRRVEPAPLAGISGHAISKAVSPAGARPNALATPPADGGLTLLRPLAEYAALVEEVAA
jgi:transposase